MDANLIAGLPQVRPLRTEQELERLQQAAAEDQHVVLAATHLVEKGGEVVGYISVGGMLTLNVWAHSQKVRARESVHLLNLAENLAAASGARVLGLPCSEQSPYFPYLEKLGYTPLGRTTLNVKVR